MVIRFEQKSSKVLTKTFYAAIILYYALINMRICELSLVKFSNISSNVNYSVEDILQ